MDTEPSKAVAQPGSALCVEPVLPEPPAPRCVAPPDFIAFFGASYKEVIRAARYVGATEHQADDAVAKAMQEVLVHWARISDPLAYAKRAAISNFIKAKTRDTDRVRRRMVQQLAYPDLEGEDPNLTVWENREWVLQMLDSLPPGQRKVMAFLVDGFKPCEIAVLLGKTPEAVRQSLHAARTRLQQRHQRDQQDSQGAERPASSPTKEARH